MTTYSVTHFSFSAEESEYLNRNSRLYFSGMQAYGHLEIKEDKLLHGDITLQMDEIHGRNYDYSVRFPLHRLYDELEKLGGFKPYLKIGVTKELVLSEGEYELYHTCHPIVYFTERQAGGNLAMFKLHTEIFITRDTNVREKLLQTLIS